MKKIITIASREFSSFFTSPVAYIITATIPLILGILFYVNIRLSITYTGYYPLTYTPDARLIVGALVTILLFTTPAITMRSVSEETRTGTIELLLTAPVRESELIIGKWLASFMFLLVPLGLTLIYPLILNFLVDPGIDWGLVWGGYLGLVLMIAAFTSLGVAVSTFFDNQIAVFFFTQLVFLLLWLIGSQAEVISGVGGDLISYLGLRQHFYGSFFNGIFDLKDAVYYCSLTFFGLLIGISSLETRRWR
jgi:ABC-2 type transport system permease protein